MKNAPRNTQTLALLTEWKWSRGELTSSLDRFTLAAAWLEHVETRFGRGYRAPSAVFRGLNEILRDIDRSTKALSYGGRTPKALSPARTEWLADWVEARRAELAPVLRKAEIAAFRQTAA